MPAWDLALPPRAPEAPSYAAPLVDFSNIGNLGNQYFQGQEQNQKLQQQNAFKNGAPTDLNSILQKTLQLGGTDAAKGLLPFMLMNQQSQQPWPGTEDTPQPQQREPIPPHGIPAQPPTRQGGDQQGSVIDAVGAAGVPDSEAGKIANTIAGRLGIDPNVPVTDPRMQTSVQNQLRAYRGTQPQQPTQAAQAQPAEDFRPYSQAELDKVKRQSIESFKRASTSPMQKEALIAQGKEFQQQYRDMLKANEGRSPSALQFEAQKAVQDEKIKRSMKTYEGINAQATQYDAGMRPYVTLSKSLLNDPTMYSGIGGQWSLDINRVKAAFGDQKAAQLQEALQKVTANTILGQINQQRNEMMEAGSNSGRLFAQQVSQVEKAAPQLATTLGGNRFLVDVQQRIGNLATKRAELARDYLSTHKYLDEGFDAKLSKWMRENPMFSKEELANPALVGAPQVPDAIAAGGRQKVEQWSAAMHLGPNDVIRTHDGRYIHPPGKMQVAPPNAAQAGQQM